MGSTRNNEVSLYGYYYPIIGEVKIDKASQWAPKQVIGDYTKDSERLTSTWGSSDHTGGIGIKDGVEGTTDNRSYWSTSEIGFNGHLVLPPLATDCTNPTTNLNDGSILIEYDNEQYCAFTTDLRKWVEGSSSWSASLGTLITTPMDAVVHKSKLYIACGTDFNRWDGSSLTTGAALSGGVKATRYLCEWDSKLFILGNDGVLQYSTDEGVTWTSLVTGTLEAGMYTSLFLDFDTNDDLVLNMGTKVGVYQLDYTNSKWIDPHLAYPQHDYAALGSNRWRGSSYVPVGMGVYQLQVSSNKVLVTPMGPDRDYGLPSDYRGNIIKIVPEHNSLFALVDATTEDARDLYSATFSWDAVFYDNVGFSVILKWNGKGWSYFYAGASDAEALKCACVSTADDYYRLWFAIDRSVYYIPLNVNLQNPLEISTYTYAASSEHIWPWNDANNSVIDKTAIRVSVYGEKLTATEYIMLYYGTDYDDNTWTLLTNTAFPDGKLDSDGEAEFTFSSDAGITYKAIRFKAVLYRGSTTTLTPDLRWLRLTYVKNLDTQYGFSMIVDCSRDYRHKRSSTLLANLKTAWETKTLGDFTYRTFQGTSESYKVQIVNFKGATQAGRTKEGQFQISVVNL